MKTHISQKPVLFRIIAMFLLVTFTFQQTSFADISYKIIHNALSTGNLGDGQVPNAGEVDKVALATQLLEIPNGVFADVSKLGTITDPAGIRQVLIDFCVGEIDEPHMINRLIGYLHGDAPQAYILIAKARTIRDQVAKGGTAISSSGAQVGMHRNFEGSVNDQVVVALYKCIDKLVEQGRVAPGKARKFKDWFKNRRKPGQNVPKSIKLTLSKLKTTYLEAYKGKILTVVEFPIKEFGKTDDGKPITAHLGLSEGVMWVAAGTEESPRRESDIRLDSFHEREEYNIAAYLADERGWSMNKMAEWRDNASLLAQTSFHVHHKESWRRVARLCRDISASGELKGPRYAQERRMYQRMAWRADRRAEKSTIPITTRDGRRSPSAYLANHGIAITSTGEGETIPGGGAEVRQLPILGLTTESTLDEIQTAINKAGVVLVAHIGIFDEEAYRRAIPELAYLAANSSHENVRNFIQDIISNTSEQMGITLSSVGQIYSARDSLAANLGGPFTIPAMNLRCAIFDEARIAFETAQKHNAGAFEIEIAPTEVKYTGHNFKEYAALVTAGAIAAGHTGPVFLKLDHMRMDPKKYRENPEAEIQRVFGIIKEAIDAGFYAIDIDASVLEKDPNEVRDPVEQQRGNFEVSAQLVEMTRAYAREKGVDVALGVEVGEVGEAYITEDHIRAFLSNLQTRLQVRSSELGWNIRMPEVLAIPTGSPHGGKRDAKTGEALDDVDIAFPLLEKADQICREFGMFGPVQHGASKLSLRLFSGFPVTGAMEIHLATAMSDIEIDEVMPDEAREQMLTEWIDSDTAQETKRKKQLSDVALRKDSGRRKHIGGYKKAFWDAPADRRAIRERRLGELFGEWFKLLGIRNTRQPIMALHEDRQRRQQWAVSFVNSVEAEAADLERGERLGLLIGTEIDVATIEALQRMITEKDLEDKVDLLLPEDDRGLDEIAVGYLQQGNMIRGVINATDQSQFEETIQQSELRERIRLVAVETSPDTSQYIPLFPIMESTLTGNLLPAPYYTAEAGQSGSIIASIIRPTDAAVMSSVEDLGQRIREDIEFLRKA